MTIFEITAGRDAATTTPARSLSSRGYEAMSQQKCYRRAVLSLALAAAGVGGWVGPAVTAETKSGQLEEIVVTATRHEESLSKVPLSVTALSQEALDQKGIKDFQDIVRFTPGVTIDTSGTNAISIRGISSSGGAGTTGIYLDDTPIQMRALGFNPDDTLPKAFDLDRIEVLRGPQGTLFGSGSEGGTVRYIFTQPSLTKDSTYLRSEVSGTRGGEPSYEAGLAHGGPLVENVLGYRASVWYRYDGGWIDRVDPTTGATVDQHANRANTVAARLAFLWQPASGLLITPSIMYQNTRKHDESTYWPAYSDLSGGHFRSGTPERIPVPDEYYLPSLKIEADLGSARLVSNTSYYHRNELTGYEGSVYDFAYFQSLVWTAQSCGAAVARGGGPATPFDPATGCAWYPILDSKGIHLPVVPAGGGNPAQDFAGYSTPNQMTNQQRTWTQELRLQSSDDTSRWKWTVGAFWSLAEELSIEQLSDTQNPAFFQALFGLDPLTVIGASNGYSCNGTVLGTPSATLPNCAIYYNQNTSHDRQLAGFGEVTYGLTDRLKATVGGRYAKMSFDLSHYGDGIENFIAEQRSGEYKENSFTPKVGLAFQADPQDLYYFTYAKGFRPGGVNPPLPLAQCGPTPLTFQSDTTQSFELGAKNNFDNRVRLASSVYYVKWDNIQQNVYIASYQGQGCGLQYTGNVGTAAAWGGDLQAEIVLGHGFSVDASLGYTSARYTKDTPKASSGDAISGEAGINYSPGTNPPWNAAVGAQYNFSAAAHDAFVRFDWEYASRNPWLAAVQNPNNATQFNPYSYTLPSTKFASLRFGVTLGGWAVAAFVDNLFDTRTTLNYALVQNDPGNPALNPQENRFTYRPRTFGLTAAYRL
jgi:iron complex outermembrane recepter protein